MCLCDKLLFALFVRAVCQDSLVLYMKTSAVEFHLRWLKTVFLKLKNSRFRITFLDCYFLMSNKDYRTDVKHRPKGSNLFTEATQLSLPWQR